MGPNGKHEGRSTAKRVMWHQDWTFMINDQRSAVSRTNNSWPIGVASFPTLTARVFADSFDTGLKILRAVRGDYNVGRQNHGHRSMSGDLMGGRRNAVPPL